MDEIIISKMIKNPNYLSNCEFVDSVNGETINYKEKTLTIKKHTKRRSY